MSTLAKHAFAVVALAGLALLPSGIAAQEEHPVQVALLAPIQAFPEDDAVRGLRLSLLYGRNSDLTGVDIGLVPHLTGDFKGVQWGAVNLVEGMAEGVQLAALVNVTPGRLNGVQLSGAVNYAVRGEGAQLASLVNYGETFRGLQISLVNYAERLHGVQVGLINVIREGGVLPVMPFVNWSLGEDPM